MTSNFGTHILRLAVDQGCEYKSRYMITFCRQKGIQITETMAYTSQQNVVAERSNRNLTEKRRAMMLEAHVLKSLWSEAVYAPVYIINRSPKKLFLI